MLWALDELYPVAVRIFHEEDPDPAAHGVRLAFEVHTAGFFQPVCQGVKVFDGEGDVAVACPELVGLLLVVVEGELQSGLGVAWHGEEGVGRIVADRRLAGKLQAKLVRIEIYAPVEIQDPVAGVYVAHRSLLRRWVSGYQHFSLSARFGLSGLRFSACQLLPFLTLPGRARGTTASGGRFDAGGEAPRRLAEVLRSRRAQRGGVLTSEGASLSVLTSARQGAC